MSTRSLLAKILGVLVIVMLLLSLFVPVVAFFLPQSLPEKAPQEDSSAP